MIKKKKRYKKAGGDKKGGYRKRNGRKDSGYRNRKSFVIFV